MRVHHWRLLLVILLSSYWHTIEAGEVAVASAQPLATQAGIEILKQGGNAFDAAVAVSAALAVVEPTGSGLGGGGFWLLHRAADGFETMIDGRETAPAAATDHLYLDANGQFNPTLSLNGPLAAAIPGVPAALVHISQQYGHLSLQQTLAPAIAYARKGFKVTPHFQRMAQFRLKLLKQYAQSRQTFLSKGTVPALATLITQPELANTLQAIAEHGRAGFYQGRIAKQLVAGVQNHGGIWTLADLHNYRVKERKPITGEYRGYKITSAALPSSGGTVLMSMLNQLEQLPYLTADPQQKRHYLIEVMRRAYRDRSQYLGDVDFVDLPNFLTKKSYAKALIKDIDPYRATASKQLSMPLNGKGEDTTHFSIIDAAGNKVSATLSINYPFGSGFIAPGTGVLLNDEMDDFSAQPGSPNVYGLTGNKANAIEAGKRPLSSMTPTFIDNKQRMMIIGTPGGSRIISMVLLGIMQFTEGADAQTIVSFPRFHHQYLPDEVQIETAGLTPFAITDLQQRGYRINQLNRHYGNMQVVIYNKKTASLTAASDPRGEGSAQVVHLPDRP